jgi:hypothetical protein
VILSAEQAERAQQAEQLGRQGGRREAPDCRDTDYGLHFSIGPDAGLAGQGGREGQAAAPGTGVGCCRAGQGLGSGTWTESA